MTAMRSTEDRFLEMDKKSSIPPPDQPDFSGSMYNKRNQYATVYSNGFFPSSSLSGKPNGRQTPLSSAGENMMNPNMTTY